MIELLLQAERALGTGALDVAERLYWQAIDADSQTAIAIVGLAKVARLKGDDRTAIAFGRRALKVTRRSVKSPARSSHIGAPVALAQITLALAARSSPA